MIYSSLLFIYGFLPLSLLIYRIIPEKFKQLSFLVLSGIFYALNSLWFLGFMVIFSVVNYLCGLFIWKYHKNKFLSAVPLFIGVLIDLIIFFIFKTDYLNIFRNKLGIPKEFFPFGISFVTSFIRSTLSSIENKGCFDLLINTPIITLSKTAAVRFIMSKCPRVIGSKLPG